ncbi:MAG: hypothetical protein U1E77_13815 [Inhella sp.]
MIESTTLPPPFNDSMNAFRHRYAGLLALAGIPQSASAAAPIYFDLAGLIYWAKIWIAGLVVMGIVSIWPRASLARGIMFGWSLAPFVWIGGVLIYTKFEQMQYQSAWDRFEDKVQKFAEERQALKLYAAAIVASDRPVSLLVSYPGSRLDAFGNPDPHSGMPAAAGVAALIADAPASCEESRIREIQFVWRRDHEELLRRFGTCPQTSDQPKATPADAEYELLLGQSQEEFQFPLPTQGLATITAFSAEIRNRRTGDTLAAQTIFQLRPGTKEIDIAKFGSKIGLINLFATSFPRAYSISGTRESEIRK